MAISIYLKSLIALPILLISYLYVRRRQSSARYHKFKAENDCGDAPSVTSGFLSSLAFFLKVLFFRGDVLDDLFGPLFIKKCYTQTFPNMFGAEAIFTTDPQNVQTVLALKFKDFEVGEGRRKFLGPLLGKGIFTVDGEDWEHLRAMIRPQFSRAQISDLEAAEKHMQKIFQILSIGPSGWTSEVDLSKVFLRFTLDSATEFLFGTSIDSHVNSHLSSSADMLLTPDEELPNNLTLTDYLRWEFKSNEMEFSRAFSYAVAYLGQKLSWQTLYGILGRRRFNRARNTMYDYVDHYVTEALQTRQSKVQETKSEVDGGRRKYVLLNELVAETQDPMELRYQLLHVLMGGRDTTAALLSWVFLLLSNYPKVFSKLRAEILSIFGPDGSTKEITFETLKSAQYLQYLLKETLRLYPIVPTNGRVAAKNTVLPVGGGSSRQQPIAVMKDKVVGYSIYHMHRREDIWGADALEFKPERWANLKSGWHYLPFHGGPRVCLGRKYIRPMT